MFALLVLLLKLRTNLPSSELLIAMSATYEMVTTIHITIKLEQSNQWLNTMMLAKVEVIEEYSFFCLFRVLGLTG